MNKFVKGAPRHGKINIPSSKSQAHRLLISSALSLICKYGNVTISYEGDDIYAKSLYENDNRECVDMVHIVCRGISEDIKATIDCINEIGRCVGAEGYTAKLACRESASNSTARLACRESASTLRFLLPVVCALGIDAEFVLKGRLAKRPIKALICELERHGARIEPEGNRLISTGRISSGEYEIPGNISSQYISGLLFALPLLDGDSALTITGDIESSSYINMTEEVTSRFGIEYEKTNKTYRIKGGQAYLLPGDYFKVGGDWSSAVSFLCMGAVSEAGVTVSGLDLASNQGDKVILFYLQKYGAKVEVNNEGDITVSRDEYNDIMHVDREIDAGEYPDIIPALSILSAGTKGRLIVRNTSRLRLKESDRLANTLELLATFGVYYSTTDDSLTITGDQNLLPPGVEKIDSHGDHRMAMAGALAAIILGVDVELVGAECVSKSYPDFWDNLESLKL